MRFEHHYIKNLRPNASLWEKFRANIIFNIGVTRFTWRDNYLTQDDYERSLPLLVPGDLILLGGHRRIAALFLRGVVTHVALYSGGGKCIHAHADGVEEIEYRSLFDEYDTLIVRRAEHATQAQLDEVIRFAKERLNAPYDFGFDPANRTTWFCTEVVLVAYAHVGVLSGIREHHHQPVRATDFLKGKFETIFRSAHASLVEGDLL